MGADFHVGLPEAEEARLAEVIDGPGIMDGIEQVLASAHPHAWRNPAIGPTEPNTPRLACG